MQSGILIIALVILVFGAGIALYAGYLIGATRNKEQFAERLRIEKETSEQRLLELQLQQHEALHEAREESARFRAALERDNAERRAELQRQERRLQQKEESLDRKIDGLEQRERFVTSVMVHAALILLGLVFFGVYTYVKNVAPHQEEVIIPDSGLINDGPPGGVPFQGLGNDPNRQALQDKVKDAGSPDGWAEKQSRTLQLEAAGGGEGDSSDSIIANGPGGGFGHGRNGRGAGRGDGLGGGEGDGGGPLAMFGTPGGGGIGPKGPVFGHGGNARKIAFVCDASGSMLNKFSTLRRELSKTVQGLRPIQSFNMIFFQEQNSNAFADSLVMATPENKVKAETFLEDKVTPKGETNPIPAIEKAFQSKPELIYLLTDGDFPDNDAVLKRIRDLERQYKVKINTIAFVSDADTDTAFMKLLETIANETGGVYKHVAENEL